MENTLKIGKYELTLKISKIQTPAPVVIMEPVREPEPQTPPASDLAYIEMNNLYVRISRGDERITVWKATQLRTLVGQAYDQGDPMVEWWGREFGKLPGWLTV